MASSSPVYKFLFREEWKLLSDALLLNPERPSDEFLSAAELSSAVNCDRAGLVICSLRDKNDLIQLATFVKTSKRLMKDSFVKIIVINFSGERQFDQAISKLGILDVIEPKITMKALRFKIDLCLKSLNTQVSSDSKKHVDLEAQIGQKNPHELTLSWINPLDSSDDVWLISKDSSCQKIGEKWLLEVTGPGPDTVFWTPVSDEPQVWQLEFKYGEREKFIEGKGEWYFRGDQKPDFNWKEKAWMFSGVSLELFFKSDKVRLIRLRSQERTLNICRNSVSAISKEELLNTSIKNATQNYKKDAPLSGVSSTDHLRYDPLSGTSSTDHLSRSGLELKLGKQQDSGPLSGTSSTDHINHKNLEMNVSPQKEGTLLSLQQDNLHHKTHYKNHNTTEVYNARDLEMNHETDHLEGFLSGKVIPLKAEPTASTEALVEASTEDAQVTFLLGSDDSFLKVSFDDYYDGKLTLKTKDHILGTGMLDLKLRASYLGETLTIETRVLLTSVDSSVDGHKVLELSVPDETCAEFDKFIELMNRRQQNAQLFITKVKGY